MDDDFIIFFNAFIKKNVCVLINQNIKFSVSVADNISFTVFKNNTFFVRKLADFQFNYIS